MMIISFISFLLLVILGHYFAWRLCLIAWPRLYAGRRYLLAGFVLITLVFLGLFMFLRGGGNPVIAGIYVAAAIMFGYLSQLMLLGAIFWLVYILGKRLRPIARGKLLKVRLTLARVAFFTASALFVLGSYNAFFPRIKTIVLKAWTPALVGQSFIQLSDLHLGAVYRPIWLEGIAAQVNARQPAFTVISGDLIDGSDKEMGEFAAPLRQLAAPVVFTPGNHDYYVYNGEMERLAADGNLILLADAAQAVDGVEIIGFNYLARQDSNIRREIKNLRTENDLPRLVLNHVPVDQAEAAALGAKLMLSGHTHRGQIFPYSLVLDFLYKQFSYGREIYGDMQTYTSAGVGSWGPPLRTLCPGEIIEFRFE